MDAKCRLSCWCHCCPVYCHCCPCWWLDAVLAAPADAAAIATVRLGFCLCNCCCSPISSCCILPSSSDLSSCFQSSIPPTSLSCSSTIAAVVPAFCSETWTNATSNRGSINAYPPHQRNQRTGFSGCSVGTRMSSRRWWINPCNIFRVINLVFRIQSSFTTCVTTSVTDFRPFLDRTREGPCSADRSMSRSHANPVDVIGSL